MSNLKCRIFGHKWDMYAGYGEIKVHNKATCLRCGRKYNGKV